MHKPMFVLALVAGPALAAEPPVPLDNPHVEWVSDPDEGHGWMLENNCFDCWRRVERFFDLHLKGSR